MSFQSSLRNGSQDEKIRVLMEFTKIGKKDAQQLLKNSDWDINNALNLFYELQAKRKISNKTKPAIDKNAIQKMFDKYEDPDKKDWITVDGTMELCTDLDIDPTQLEFLLLSYHLGSDRMGEFNRQKFLDACIQMGCDSLDKLKSTLVKAKSDLENPDYFRKIYNYAFLFGRQSGQKNLSLDAAVELWKLLLTGRFSMVDQWVTFLEEKHRKAISRDTWNLFLDFATQPSFNTDTHDAEGAWPILIDEFVEYIKETSS